MDRVLIPMPMHTWNGTQWRPTKTLSAWDPVEGNGWVKGKKAKVYDPDRGGWVLAWVHPVVNASLSLSKYNVLLGEKYDVVLTAPEGFPEGAAVTFRFTGYSYTVYPEEGATTAALSGASHATAGTYSWYADVTTKGGNTSFGPVSQSADTPTTAVILTCPAWALSTQSGSGGASSIVASTFTIDLSNSSLVSSMAFQLSYQGGGWVDYANWGANPGSRVTHSMKFSTSGTWRARVVVAQTNGVTVYSAEKSMPCYIKHLSVVAKPTNPVVGDSVTLTASHSGDALAATSGRWQYMYTSNGIWVDNWSTANPVSWLASGVNDIQWRWAETFSDGSWIISNTVRSIISPAPVTHYHEVVPSGSSRAQIQAAMDRAYNYFVANQTGTAVNFDSESTMACVELVANGSYTLDGSLYVRRGVRLIGAGSGASRPIVYAPKADSVIFRTGNNGGGGYNSPYYDWLVQNIRFDCQKYTGGFSISHCRRFRIKDCAFSNLGGMKHYIEINSSGGARSDGTYNVQILNCYFTMTNKDTLNGKDRRTADECIQCDYSWAKSASDVANDGTVTNNVLVDGCHFYRVPRGVGAHHYEEGVVNSSGTQEKFPLGMTSNVVVQNCHFQEVNPVDYGSGANGAGSEGAFRAYVWSNVHVLNNTFTSCYQPINFYINAGATTRNGNPTYYRVAGNVIMNKTSTRPGITATSAHSSMVHQQVLVESNTVDGSWGGTDYMVAIQNTGTQTLPASDSTVVIRTNMFKPTNLSLADEKAYNKYRAKGANNAGKVLIYDNKVSDNSTDNS